RERIRVPGVMVVGSYGMSGEPLSPAVLRDADEAARRIPGAWTEAKGPSVAVHYRETADPAASRETLTVSLGSLASRAGLQLLEGKMVLELVRPGVALKGGAVQRICRDRGLDAALYAG